MNFVYFTMNDFFHFKDDKDNFLEHYDDQVNS